ncbi:TPA: hypothetical protein ACX6SG_003419 [Photobacterium damselae]
MNILVNGSGASMSGALTILNKYLESIKYDDDNKYYIFCPVEPQYLSKNIKWVHCDTNGFHTYLFALFFCYYYILLFKCDKVVSFSNINTVFPVKNKVTYFHQALIFKNKRVKFSLLRFTIKFLFQRNSKIICQTTHVKTEFEKCFGYNYNIEVKWPGLSVVTKNSKNTNSFEYLVFPVSSINDENKNFKLLVEIANKLLADNNDVKIIVPSVEISGCPENIIFVGSKCRDDFISLLKFSNGVLITSFYETLCLPIFEAICLEKKVYVLQREYLVGVENVCDLTNWLFKFNNSDEFVFLYEINKVKEINNIPDFDFHTGDWSF